MSTPKHDAVRPIITWASDWDVGIERARQELRTSIVPCPDCGGLRYAGTGPHAPRWLGGRKVDCCGRTVNAAGGAR